MKPQRLQLEMQRDLFEDPQPRPRLDSFPPQYQRESIRLLIQLLKKHLVRVDDERRVEKEVGNE